MKFLLHDRSREYSVVNSISVKSILLYKSIGHVTWWSRKNRELNLFSITLYSLIAFTTFSYINWPRTFGGLKILKGVYIYKVNFYKEWASLIKISGNPVVLYIRMWTNQTLKLPFPWIRLCGRSRIWKKSEIDLLYLDLKLQLT